MPKLSVAERLEKVAQQKAKTERLEARLKLMQRKEETRSMAEISRLAVKAGIDSLSPAALYGCFLQIAAEATDPQKIAAWEAAGEKGLSAPVTDHRIVAVARFPAKADAALSAQLRTLGFRWNSILAQWEGRVIPAEASPIVTGAGGTMTEVQAKPDTPPDTPEPAEKIAG